MAKATRFTDRFIASLKPEKKEYWKREGQGFAIRVLPSGEKIWYFVYTFEGRKRYMRLKAGGYPDVSLANAREAFDAARVKLANGVDPLAEKEHAAEERRKAPTVADLVKDYIDRHAKRFKRSWAKDEQILNREVIPAWGKRKAADIEKKDVVKLCEAIVNREAPGMANNTFQIIRKMFNWSVEKDILKLSPCAGAKLPAPKNSRNRFLSADEIRTLWESLDRTDLSITPDICRALKLILITAQRPNEVAGMHSSEIEDRWWTLPVARQKVSKAKEHERSPHRVYLTDLALELIGPLEVTDPETGETKPRGYIFPTPLKKKDQPVGDTALAVAVGRNLAYPLTDAKGNPLYNKDGTPATENKLGVEHFTPHDLRRTATTLMAASKVIKEHRERVLNHVFEKLDGTYNQHDYDDEKIAALEALERKLRVIISCGTVPDNVRSLEQARGKVKAS